MGRSESVFQRDYWLGSVDPRPLALLRIGVGVTILHDLLDYTRDLRAFLTDDGMLPRSIRREWWAVSVFDWVGSVTGVSIVFALGFAAVLAFTVGYRTRIATALSWVFLASLNNRNYYVTDGGDDLARILLFWGFFAELGAAYGVDAARRAKKIVDVPAFGLRLLQLQVAMLYLAAGRLKFRAGWLRINAIYQTLQLDGFVRPAGAWLGRHPSLCRMTTISVMVLEVAFAFLAFSPWLVPWARAGAIACGTIVQLGILLTMRVGIFTELMLWVAVLWLLPEWLDRAEGWVRRRLRRSARADERPSAAIASSRAWRIVHAVVAVQFVLAIWDIWVGGRFPLPKAIQDERIALGVVAKYGLFDSVWDIPRWDAPGVLDDGRPTEVLSVAAPGARPREAATRFSRWNKFTFKERDFAFHFPELGDYLCRKYDEVTGARLSSFTLVDDLTPPHDVAGAAPPAKHRILWRQTCSR